MAQHNISINASTYDLSKAEWRKYLRKLPHAEFVYVWFLSVIEIPVMIVTLIALCSLIKARPAASAFVSQLIISDLMQTVCILVAGTTVWTRKLSGAYYYSLIAGVYFMACVALERYLLVSHPIWYKSHHSAKVSCLICLIVWFMPLIFAEIKPPHIYFRSLRRFIACLIPYILIVLCFAGTWRGLPRSRSLTDLKRKLILGSLFLVLLSYTFLILPFVIMHFIINYTKVHRSPYKHLSIVKFYRSTRIFLYVNPLADCLLYLFMRPDVGDIMKSVHCCWKHKQDQHSVENPQNSCSTVVCCISARKPASHSLNTCSSV